MTNLIDDEESAAELQLSAHEFHALTLLPGFPKALRDRDAIAALKAKRDAAAAAWFESRTVF